MSTDKELENKELELLRTKADMMNVQYHPNTGAKKLAELITAREAEIEEQTNSKPAVRSAAARTGTRDHLKLVRVVVTPLDETKTGYDGEYFTVGNAKIGTFRYFVPYNLTQGWHLPQIIVDMLRDKRFQKFVTKKNRSNGIEEAHSITTPQFQITELEPLTKEQLDKLAADQRARGAIDKE